MPFSLKRHPLCVVYIICLGGRIYSNVVSRREEPVLAATSRGDDVTQGGRRGPDLLLTTTGARQRLEPQSEAQPAREVHGQYCE